MKLTKKAILREFQRTYQSIERISQEKAESEKKHEEFLRSRRESSESHRNIERIRKIIQSR